MTDDSPPEYRTTLFDRDGPDAGNSVRTWAYGGMVFGIALLGGLIATLGGGAAVSFETLFVILAFALVFGGLATGAGLLASKAAGATYTRLMVDGSTTPYKEQYSYQQALVMQGRTDAALESFEAVIAEQPLAVDPRVKAAELYARDAGNPARAAELLRQIQRIPSATHGEVVYATNRLVDLLNGPLADPGRALVELRRLVVIYPGTAAAEHARAAIATLKLN